MRDHWTFQGAFGRIELELRPGAVDLASVAETEQHVRQLARDFVNRRPEARRIVRDLCIRLSVMPRGLVLSDPFDLDIGSPGAQAIADALLRGARSAGLVARAQQTRSVVVPLGGTPEEVLGPDPSQDAAPDTTSWIGMVLLDQNGTPVPNRAYRVVLPDGSVLDGTLDTNGSAILKNLTPGSCQISCPYVEPHPDLTYSVEPGDHLSGIAAASGFDDYTVVWNRPENADLKSLRQYPHELVPGDKVYIPEIKDTPVSKPTGAKHTFTLQVSPLKLQVKVLKLSLKPLASGPCTLDGVTETTDGGGLVQEPIDKSARAAFLSVQGADLALQVGRLAPIDDPSDAGWKARLFNLGFLLDPEAEDGDEELRIALQDFQAEYQLQVTGAFDDPTKTQLQQIYGC
jgi:hypothetical protein